MLLVQQLSGRNTVLSTNSSSTYFKAMTGEVPIQASTVYSLINQTVSKDLAIIAEDQRARFYASKLDI